MNERAKRLSEAIEKSGYSYPELEKITGIPKSSIQRYATGVTKKIPIDCIELIALATNTDSRYLMCWDDLPTADSSDMSPEAVETASMIHEAENTEEIINIVETVIEDDDYRAIVTASKELTPEEMKMVRAMIEGLVNNKE
jgi:transcriptional regulator with XRE-family HTH domain